MYDLTCEINVTGCRHNLFSFATILRVDPDLEVNDAIQRKTAMKHRVHNQLGQDHEVASNTTRFENISLEDLRVKSKMGSRRGTTKRHAIGCRVNIKGC